MKLKFASIIRTLCIFGILFSVSCSKTDTTRNSQSSESPVRKSTQGTFVVWNVSCLNDTSGISALDINEYSYSCGDLNQIIVTQYGDQRIHQNHDPMGLNQVDSLLSIYGTAKDALLNYMGSDLGISTYTIDSSTVGADGTGDFFISYHITDENGGQHNVIYHYSPEQSYEYGYLVSCRGGDCAGEGAICMAEVVINFASETYHWSCPCQSDVCMLVLTAVERRN